MHGSQASSPFGHASKTRGGHDTNGCRAKFRDSSATAVQRSGQLVFGDNTVSVRVQLFKVDLHPGGTCTSIALLAGNVDVTKASANLEFCASSTKHQSTHVYQPMDSQLTQPATCNFFNSSLERTPSPSS